MRVNLCSQQIVNEMRHTAETGHTKMNIKTYFPKTRAVIVCLREIVEALLLGK